MQSVREALLGMCMGDILKVHIIILDALLMTLGICLSNARKKEYRLKIDARPAGIFADATEN